ncbi:MAG: 2Fe-2S ferredoxin [Oceanococcaceae bacterium]
MSAINFVYVDAQGEEHPVEAQAGSSLMEVAVANGISGIDGDCGGCCACGTCRVQFSAELYSALGEQQSEEKDLLEFVGNDREHVRLGCQIPVGEHLQGAKITVAT